MAIREKLAKNAASYLQPEESVQAVFIAQTMLGFFPLLLVVWLIAGQIAPAVFELIAGLLLLVLCSIVLTTNLYRVVVVTDRRILVGLSGGFRPTRVKELVRELPRNTRIGPAHGLWYKAQALGERLYVAKRFHKDIAAADAAPGSA